MITEYKKVPKIFGEIEFSKKYIKIITDAIVNDTDLNVNAVIDMNKERYFLLYHYIDLHKKISDKKINFSFLLEMFIDVASFKELFATDKHKELCLNDMAYRDMWFVFMDFKYFNEKTYTDVITSEWGEVLDNRLYFEFFNFLLRNHPNNPIDYTKFWGDPKKSNVMPEIIHQALYLVGWGIKSHHTIEKRFDFDKDTIESLHARKTTELNQRDVFTSTFKHLIPENIPFKLIGDDLKIYFKKEEIVVDFEFDRDGKFKIYSIDTSEKWNKRNARKADAQQLLSVSFYHNFILELNELFKTLRSSIVKYVNVDCSKTNTFKGNDFAIEQLTKALENEKEYAKSGYTKTEYKPSLVSINDNSFEITKLNFMKKRSVKFETTTYVKDSNDEWLIFNEHTSSKSFDKTKDLSRYLVKRGFLTFFNNDYSKNVEEFKLLCSNKKMFKMRSYGMFKGDEYFLNDVAKKATKNIAHVFLFEDLQDNYFDKDPQYTVARKYKRVRKAKYKLEAETKALNAERTKFSISGYYKFKMWLDENRKPIQKWSTFGY